MIVRNAPHRHAIVAAASIVLAALVLSVLALGAAAEGAAADDDEASGPDERLDATAWVQLSAEFRASARQAYATATLRLEEALADPTWTALPAQRGETGLGALPTAVVLDVDETVLDNAPYQARSIRDATYYGRDTWNPWCEEAAAGAIPGALAFCRRAAERGATVFYVTNRRDELREATRKNLARLGFPLTDAREVVLTRGETSDKEPRRLAVAKTHRILLLVGDNLGDFSSAFDDLATDARNAAADERAALWGVHWIVIPNPMYGAWETAIFHGRGRLGPAERIAAKRAALAVDGPRPYDREDGAEPDGDGGKKTEKPEKRYVAAPGANGDDDLHAADRVAAPIPARDLLESGPMAGAAEMTETVIWVQTRRAAACQLRFWAGSDPARARLSKPIATAAEGDFIATFRLDRLAEGTEYAYELFIDGERIEVDHALRFKTKPRWRYRSDPPTVDFLIGSCSYVNEARYDRNPDKPYGGDHEIFTAMAAEKADFMVWLGDNIYYREPDWDSEAGLRRRNRHDRALPVLQAFLGSTNHYAIWDDHDFGPNDSDRTFRLRRESLEVFSDYWPGPSYGIAGTPGCFHRFDYGDVDLFLLDDRYHRSPNATPDDDSTKVMLGEEQLDWLIDGLTASTAPFKLVACGGQIVNPLVYFEGFGKFPAERARLYDTIAARRIEGVVFLSGDRHHTELLKVTPFGGYPLYDYTSSPLTSGAGRLDREADNPARVEGTWVTGTRNYGRVRVDGPRGARKLTLSAHDKAGARLWSHEIGEDELRFPANERER